MGGVLFGTKLDEKDSFRLMDHYVELGGNMIDTAQIYANWLSAEPSMSERTIGSWMKARGNLDRMIVTTKGAHQQFAEELALTINDIVLGYLLSQPFPHSAGRLDAIRPSSWKAACTQPMCRLPASRSHFWSRMRRMAPGLRINWHEKLDNFLVALLT